MMETRFLTENKVIIFVKTILKSQQVKHEYNALILILNWMSFKNSTTLTITFILSSQI